jgi:hypothetical protein
MLVRQRNFGLATVASHGEQMHNGGLATVTSHGEQKRDGSGGQAAGLVRVASAAVHPTDRAHAGPQVPQRYIHRQGQNVFLSTDKDRTTEAPALWEPYQWWK